MSVDPFFIALFLAFVLPVPLLLYAVGAFDRLIRTEHDEHRVAWERDRRPAGVIWRSAESHPLWGRIEGNRLSFVWLIKTPGWMFDSMSCRLVLHRYRICFCGYMLASLALFFTLFALLK
jgi:hypothetical protein